MNKNLQIIVISALSIIAIISIVTAIHSSNQKSTIEAENIKLLAQIADLAAANAATNMEPIVESDSPSTKTNEVAALKTLLAKQNTELEKLRVKLNREQQRQLAESFQERMARIKEEDPERYAEMIQRRTERRQAMRYSLAERTATFMDLDTSNMTKEERDAHELLVQKMANIWELTSKLQDAEAMPDRETMRELFTEMREARPLMDQTRGIMLKQLGSDIGYEGEDADAFSSHIEEIISATTLRPPGGGFGRSFGGGFRGEGGQRQQP